MTQKSGAFIRTDGALPTSLRKYVANTWNSFVSFVVVNMFLLNPLCCELFCEMPFINNITPNVCGTDVKKGKGFESRDRR